MLRHGLSTRGVGLPRAPRCGEVWDGERDEPAADILELVGLSVPPSPGPSRFLLSGHRGLGPVLILRGGSFGAGSPGTGLTQSTANTTCPFLRGNQAQQRLHPPATRPIGQTHPQPAPLTARGTENAIYSELLDMTSRIGTFCNTPGLAPNNWLLLGSSIPVCTGRNWDHTPSILVYTGRTGIIPPL